MAKGLPKSIIKKYGITKKAWSVFRGKKKRTSRTRKAGPTRRKGVRKLGKKRRSKQMTVPISIVGGLGAGLAEPIMWAIGGDYDGAMYKLLENYTGYNIRTQQWNIAWARGIPPLIIAALIHKFVGGAPLNINRTLARAGIPFIRI